MFTGMFIGVSATALIGWFVWAANKDIDKKYIEPEVKPIGKTYDQWKAEAKEKLIKAKAENTKPPYRICKNKNTGKFFIEYLMIVKANISSHYPIKDYSYFETDANIYWNMIRTDEHYTLEDAETWLATYIAAPEITYYNGPPLKKVVDFNG